MFKEFFNEVVIRLTIRPTGPILIKAGEKGADPTRPDMEFVRTWRGSERVVYLPGASLKGVLRAHCERIVRTVAQEENNRQPRACDPLGKQSCSERLGRIKGLPTERAYSDSCFICRLFGNQVVAGRLRTSDAYPTVPIKTEQRDGVAIDRVFGAVAFGPFQFETVSEGAFATTLTLRNFTVAQLGLLGLALRDLRRGQIGVGFGKSRGLGQVTADFTQLTIRYPACEVRDHHLYLLGRTTPVAAANSLPGAGAFLANPTSYGVTAADVAALPAGLQLAANDWQEAELTLTGDAVEQLWRAAVPHWQQAMGIGV